MFPQAVAYMRGYEHIQVVYFKFTPSSLLVYQLSIFHTSSAALFPIPGLFIFSVRVYTQKGVSHQLSGRRPPGRVPL